MGQALLQQVPQAQHHLPEIDLGLQLLQAARPVRDQSEKLAAIRVGQEQVVEVVVHHHVQQRHHVWVRPGGLEVAKGADSPTGAPAKEARACSQARLIFLTTTRLCGCG